MTDTDAPPVPEPVPEKLPDEISHEATKDDKIWKKPSKHTDRFGIAYDPYMIEGAIFFNYYITYISLFLHVCTMTYGLNYWCRYSKLVCAYSF